MEEYLTKRDVKKPHFQFDTTTKSGQKVKTVGAVSLSGSGALTAIANKEEFSDMIPDMTNLFEGVWKDEEVLIGSNDNENSVKVLKQMYPSLFSKPNPTKMNENYGYISVSDAAELMRESLASTCAPYFCAVHGPVLTLQVSPSGQRRIAKSQCYFLAKVKDLRLTS